MKSSCWSIRSIGPLFVIAAACIWTSSSAAGAATPPRQSAVESASFASPERRKLDATAQVALSKLNQGGSPRKLAAEGMAVTADGALDVFIRGNVSREELEAIGIRVRTALPGLFTADVPVSAVDALTAMDRVAAVEGSQPGVELLNAGVPATGASVLRGAAPNFTGLNGDNVLIGIVDSGIDYQHGDFDDPSGNTRIVSIWDQLLSGTPPAGFSYGHECTQAEIDAGTCPEIDDDGHGTWVTGIAGGDGSQTGGSYAPYTFAGMAPQADLVVVKSPIGMGTTKWVDGIKYCFDVATARGQNCVVNLSRGYFLGSHDGHSILEEMTSALCGPGRIVVVSAANFGGGLPLHAEVFAAGTGTDAVFSVDGSRTSSFIIEGVYESTEDVSIQLTTPSGFLFPPVPLGFCFCSGVSTPNGTVYIFNSATNTDGDHFITIVGLEGAGQDIDGNWTMKFIPVALGPANGEVDLWCAPAFGEVAFTVGVDPSTELITEPANAREVITVGGWVTKNSWTGCNGVAGSYSEPIGALYLGSSPGPTRDGRHKPDIAAPAGLTSTWSQDVPYTCPSPPDVTGVIADGLNHWQAIGTSGSAPIVSGAVAILMQKYGALTPQQLKDFFTARAITDGFTGPVWNNQWGNGKLFLGDLTDPVVQVIAPNGGEHLGIGTGTTLKWSATDVVGGVTGVDLALSRDNGGSFAPIATGIANTGSYAWAVTGPATTTALLRVTAHDAAANTGQDLSNNVFSIVTNICGNPGFEDSPLFGWARYGDDVTLSRVQGGAHGGNGSMKVRSGSSSTFGCDDSPDWVRPVAGPGAAYRFTAWVKSTDNTKKIKFRLIEVLNGSQVGSSVYSNEESLSGTWKPLTAVFVAQRSGSSLSMRFTESPDSYGKSFQVDDVVIELVPTFTIVSSAGAGGTISPLGNKTVVEGGSQSYTINASSGYHIDAVLVDGGSVGAVSSYPFSNVIANHTIEAKFAANPAGANLVGNPGFETSDISRWKKYGSYVTLSRVQPLGGAHGGDYALQLSSASSSSFGCYDSPGWVTPVAGAGARYKVTAWVKSLNNTGRVRIRVIEVDADGDQVGSSQYSNEPNLSGSWKPLTAYITAVKSSSSLSVRISESPDASGKSFYLDDVSISLEPVTGAMQADRAGDEEGGALRFGARVMPNPARGAAVLRFATTQTEAVRVQLFDVTGREVARLMDEQSAAPAQRSFVIGSHETRRMKPGIYYYRIEAGEGTLRGRFTILD